MNQLDRDGWGIEQVGIHAEAFPGSVDEQRPYALAAIENGVAHRFVQALRRNSRGRQRRIEASVNALLVVANAVAEILRHDPSCVSGRVAYIIRFFSDRGTAGMQATAIAQPNIALIKYWGKRDVARNLPAVGSISITLSDLFTRMRVEFDAALGDDELTVNESPDIRMLPRLSACLDRVAGERRFRARISST